MKYLDYPEQQKHGDLDFPYFFYHVTPRHPRYAMPYHWHPLYEIVHVFEGRFHLKLNDCELLLTPGDSALIQGGITHGGAPSKTEECCYECMLMDLDTIFHSFPTMKSYEKNLTDLLNQKMVLKSFFPADQSEINHLILEMLNLLRYKPEGYPLILYGYTFLFFGTLFQNHDYQTELDMRHTKRFQILKNVFTFIEEHYQENVTLSSLASCANMNPSYFCRYFKEFTRRTPMDYLNYYRVEVACEQLSYTNKSITEVAYDCGFSDPSYFIKVFRHYKRMTPTEYLKEPYV